MLCGCLISWKVMFRCWCVSVLNMFRFSVCRKIGIVLVVCCVVSSVLLCLNSSFVFGVVGGGK